MDLQILLKILVSGAIATAALDISVLTVRALPGFPVTNWGKVGRWLTRLPFGEFVLRNPGDIQPNLAERSIGWTFHYAIGIVYAALYIGAVSVSGLEEPTLVSGIVFGLATIVAPWLIFQPAMGVGMFARLAPRPNLVRLHNLCMHTLFGVALFAGWQPFL